MTYRYVDYYIIILYINSGLERAVEKIDGVLKELSGRLHFTSELSVNNSIQYCDILIMFYDEHTCRRFHGCL